MRRFAAAILIVLHATLLSAQIMHWEDPQVLVADGARFPQAVSGGGLVAVVWQEFEASRVWLSLRTSRDLVTWTERRRFAGPYPYEGEQAPLFSAEADDRGRLYVAVASSDRQTTILTSADGGSRFVTTTITAPVTTVAPRLSARADGTVYLFLIYDVRGSSSLGIYYTILEPQTLEGGGALRRQLLPLAGEEPLRFSFLPSHASLGGRDYVVYQSQDNSQGQSTFQLWLRVSDGSGRFAAPAIPLTSFEERAGGSVQAAELFDNQRPHLAALPDRLALVWERRLVTGPRQVYYMELSPDGAPLRPAEAGASAPPYVRVVENSYDCFFPQTFVFRDRMYVMWFDNRRGDNHVFVAQRDGGLWRDRDLSMRLAGTSIYPWFVETESTLAILWENRQGNRSRLVMGGPDQTASPPRIFAQGFTPGLPARASRVSVTWNVPNDAAGIQGFAWSWSQDAAAVPEQRLMGSVENTRLDLEASADGRWHFSVAAVDFAGNWSRPSRISYVRDTQPPPPVVFEPLAIDERGFVASNSFAIQWKAGDGEAASGYAYDLMRVAADPRAPLPADPPRAALAPQVRTQVRVRPYDNLENGLWAFSVAAVDLAGNVGPPAVAYLRLNKYVPVTLITSVDWVKDDLGRVSLSIRGRGFTEDGRIRQVFVDRDGQEPFDYGFGPADFTLSGDRLIEGVTLSRYDEGTYRIGVVHSKRGVTVTAALLTLDAFGTVKLGDFAAASYTTPWEIGARPRYVLSADRLITGLLMAFMAFALVASAGRVLAVAREARVLRQQVFAAVSGAAAGKEVLMRELKSRGMSLRVKFTLLIVALVILIVLMISVPLSINMVETQQRNLALGLEQRVRVLLGSISAAAGPFLIDQKPTDLAGLLSQISAMPEAEYATITGITPRDSDRPGGGEEYVWATNDAEIARKIGGEFEPGISVLKDEVSPVVAAVAEDVNRRALADVGALVQELDRQLQEVQPLYGRADAQSKLRVEQIGKSTAGLQVRINNQLRAIASHVGSLPEFRRDQLQRHYIFHQPIVFRVLNSDIYFRGLVRLSVSADAILEEITSTTRRLYRTIGLTALAAIALGTLGALILASITIGPIRKLAAGVARIRDTEDKEELKDHRIEVRQKDEIRTLADTINEMTQGLVKAAIASKDLTVGKEIQKMFLPLAVDSEGRKGTTASESTDAVDIFGYYEGAKGVSGDFFDYRRLDAEHYALIKVDVSGKGVPAALIMVEVATVFQTFFKNWTLQNPGLRIDRFAYQVNDMLEERGFKGRFAAFMLCVVNVKSGVCVMVNAGDNIVHIYSARERRMVIKQHPKAPAAGPFPSVLIEAQAGFKAVTERLERGDTLFLITDGIEEAQRLFRDRKFQPLILEEDEQVEVDGETISYSKGSAFEQLTIPRLQHIVSAVYGRGSYELRRHHDPTPEDRYEFDFSNCRGTVEEAVLALIAVQQVFRLIRDPSAGENDVVTVDSKIDLFLKEHFKQYGLYFGHPLARAQDPGHVSFSNLKEDAQYDDLTILALRRK